MRKEIDFTQGNILASLMLFVFPVLFAIFLQAMYGAVDLLIVGKFASPVDVSAVSTGSQIMMTLTNFLSSLAMGLTIYLGQKMGERDYEGGGRIVGSGILLFLVLGVFFMFAIPFLSPQLAGMMQAPEEAYADTASYIRICGMGSIVIIGYNLIGSIFRGIGDSRTPLITVLIACICNIAGDYILIAIFGMGTRGAAIATVFAQFISVVISLLMIHKKGLPFAFGTEHLKPSFYVIKKILGLGVPLALQDFLVGISFLVILAIVNTLGVTASAGVGVSEKVCTFIMLVPISFMQAMSAFVAQNRGAGKIDRAIKGLYYAVGISFLFGLVMFYISFFHGNLLSEIFARDEGIIEASTEFLKAYGIDCLLTCFLFCFTGFYNGMEHTRFVMIDGLIGAFAIRIPVAYIMSKWEPVELFHIGLGIPCSTVVQIIMYFIFFLYLKKSGKLVAKTVDKKAE